MHQTEKLNNSLPLISPSSCTRNIKVESCLIDERHEQIRGELVTKRSDYEQADITIENQCIVVRLTICLDDNSITNADFSMPISGFPDVCEHMPLGPDLLLGLKIEQGVLQKINSIFTAPETCADLQILLQAMIRLIPAMSAINSPFRLADEHLPAEEVPSSIQKLMEASHNVCHAYSDRKGSIMDLVSNGEYEKVLTRIGNRISKRWDSLKRNQDLQND